MHLFGVCVISLIKKTWCVIACEHLIFKFDIVNLVVCTLHINLAQLQ